MKGEIGGIISAAAGGNPTARKHVSGIFAKAFQSPVGWRKALAIMPNGNVGSLLDQAGAAWTLDMLHTLYIACWIHHPVEKGAYMIALSDGQHTNAVDAFAALTASGAIQPRISSHLSKQGISAHQGWDFLNGYGELLIQIEGGAGRRYLYLKCEGHPIGGGIGSFIGHMAAWAKKNVTGSGMTASPELNAFAGLSSNAEPRAAENYSNTYKKLLEKLGLKGTNVSVDQVMATLLRRAGHPGEAAQVAGLDTHELGGRMRGDFGYIAMLKARRDVLKKNGVDFSAEVETELRGIAERMLSTAQPHARQFFNEVRVMPAVLSASVQNFNAYM